MDKYAHQCQWEPQFENKTYYGQLQHIFAIQLPAILSLGLSEPSMIFLAAIKMCNMESFDWLRNPYYSKLGPLEVIDMSCVQCRVGSLTRVIMPVPLQTWMT